MRTIWIAYWRYNNSPNSRCESPLDNGNLALLCAGYRFSLVCESNTIVWKCIPVKQRIYPSCECIVLKSWAYINQRHDFVTLGTSFRFKFYLPMVKLKFSWDVRQFSYVPGRCYFTWKLIPLLLCKLGLNQEAYGSDDTSALNFRFTGAH